MTKQQRNIALIVSFILTLILCYQLAIKNSLEIKKQHMHLVSEVESLKNAPQQLSLLKQKKVYYDSLLTTFQLNDSSIQNNLLKVINTYANSNNLKVIDFLEPHVSTIDELVINTYDFTLEGSYNSINQLVYYLEQQTKFGEVISLHFEKKKNHKTGRLYLQARVLLKNFG